MARIVPSDIGTLVLAGVASAEIDTLKRLRDELPAEFTVFHGVHWTREQADWCLFGEIDFAVVSPTGRVLLIEQKNGALEERGGRLLKNYDDRQTDVVQQIHRSLDAVRAKFKARHPDGGALCVDYLIYCPDHRLVNVNAIGADASRIVDRRSVAELASVIRRLLSGDPPPHAAQASCVRQFFEQTLRLVPDVGAHTAAQERSFTRLTQGLADTIRRLEFEPFRLRVVGAPGSGKSQVALDFYTRALAHGRRPLLVCFNRPLADRMRRLLPAGGECDTYHGFLDRFLRRHGVVPEFERLGNSPELWAQVQEQVIALMGPEDAKFGALIVDEGQDFQSEWLEVLRLFLEPDARVLWLEDPEQNLYGRPPIELPGFVTYRETRNFRTPRSIARFIEAVLGIEVDAQNRTAGLGVGVYSYESLEEQIELLAHRVTELMRQGFRPEDIAIVSCVGLSRASFKGIEHIGAQPLRRFTERYSTEGEPIYTDGRLLAETIYRFKGQQAPAVILMDFEPVGSEALLRRLLYCGMTRATVRLEMLMHARHPMVGVCIANADRHTG